MGLELLFLKTGIEAALPLREWSRQGTRSPLQKQKARRAESPSEEQRPRIYEVPGSNLAPCAPERSFHSDQTRRKKTVSLPAHAPRPLLHLVLSSRWTGDRHVQMGTQSNPCWLSTCFVARRPRFITWSLSTSEVAQTQTKSHLKVEIAVSKAIDSPQRHLPCTQQTHV